MLNTSPSEIAEREVFMDWLRVIAIGFLLLFHTGMLFVGWGWHIVNTGNAAMLELPMDIAHRLRMPLLFVIAGASMHYALGRRGAFAVLTERSKRLLLPLVAGMFIVVPPQIYFEQLFRQQWLGTYASFYLERILDLPTYPGGLTNWHHLWFIAYLFVYCLALLPVFAWWRKRRIAQPGLWVYLPGLVLGVNEALLRPRFPETHNLFSDWYIVNHYALLFVYGFLLCGVADIWNWLMLRRRVNLLLGAGLTAGILMLEALGVRQFQDDTRGDAVSANLFTWIWLLVLLGYGKRWLSFSNATLRYLNEACYPIYLLHQTIIIAVGFFVIQQPWSWQQKYLVVLGATLVLCFGLYEGLIRRWQLSRLLFGMKGGPRITKEGFRRTTTPGAERY